MSDASSATVIQTGSGFTIGDVFGRSFSLLGRNLMPFMILSGVAMIPYLYIYWAQAGLMFHEPGAIPMIKPSAIKSLGMVAIPAFVLTMLSQAAVLSAAFQGMRGQPILVGASLRNGLSRFFPIIGLLICEGIALMFGFALLIVPGIILFVMWYAALPVCVVEKLGPIQSLGRSAALTKGHRWKLLGIILVIGIVGGIVNGIVGAIFGLIHIKLVFAIGLYLWQTLYTAFGAITVAVIYNNLRVAKDGIDTEQIAAVFD